MSQEYARVGNVLRSNSDAATSSTYDRVSVSSQCAHARTASDALVTPLTARHAVGATRSAYAPTSAPLNGGGGGEYDAVQSALGHYERPDTLLASADVHASRTSKLSNVAGGEQYDVVNERLMQQHAAVGDDYAKAPAPEQLYGDVAVGGGGAAAAYDRVSASAPSGGGSLRTQSFEPLPGLGAPPQNEYDVVQPASMLSAYDRMAPDPDAKPVTRKPKKSDYAKKPFFFKKFDHEQAVAHLQKLGAQPGMFVLRPSSHPKCLALTHIESDGSFGRAVVQMRDGKGKNKRCGYSIEKSQRDFETLEDLFAQLPGLKRSMYGLGPDVPADLKP